VIPALLLTIASATLNASWNVLLKTAADPLRVATQAVTLTTLVGTPFVAVAWVIAGYPMPSAWTVGIAALSALVELAYFICLSAAYRRGEISQVYPLARGSAPLLAVLAGILVLHERLRGAMSLGILLLLAGIWMARRPMARSTAVLPALLTGACIATYSALDSVGTGAIAPWTYGWLLWAFTTVWLLAWALVRRVARGRSIPDAGSLDAGSAPDPVEAPALARSLIMGLLMTASYWLVLLAFRLAPLAVVAPLRESSVVLVTCWGIWQLDERHGRGLRLAGAVAILCGVALLAL
jgi:drug/metabolite transporter (DMT)-like permease